MIETKKDKLYCGITKDLEKRFQQHLNKKGAKYFYSDTPVKIVYHEKHDSRSSALKREAAIKKLSRKQKLDIVNTH